MNIFLAASFSAKINYETRAVLPEYKAWLEALIAQLEATGNHVFCALRDERYVVNDKDPVAAFEFDIAQLAQSDVLFAVTEDTISAGVQLEIGWAYAKSKRIILAHAAEHKLPYVNDAMVSAGLASELLLPLDEANLARALGQQSAEPVSR